MAADPLTTAVSERICRHMNDDHSDAVLRFAQHYGGISTAQSAAMTAVRPDAMELAVDGTTIQIDFDHALTDSEDAHRTLVAMLRAMPAAEAQQAGLVNRVFPDQATMLAEVMEIAGQIASKAPVAVYGSKRMINYARDHSTADALDYISIWNTGMMDREEILEAISAKAEQRSGDYVDLPARG